jgi:hypothetical protein
VQNWDEEAEEIKAAAKEEELVRVQQEIERLQQEQESIMRHQVIAQCAEARWQHINRERASLASYNTVSISFDSKSSASNPTPSHLHQTILFLHHLRLSMTSFITSHIHHYTINTSHHLRRNSALQTPKAH